MKRVFQGILLILGLESYGLIHAGQIEGTSNFEDSASILNIRPQSGIKISDYTDSKNLASIEKDEFRIAYKDKANGELIVLPIEGALLSDFVFKNKSLLNGENENARNIKLARELIKYLRVKISPKLPEGPIDNLNSNRDKVSK